ncbi:MAG: DUF6339 family protein [Chthoniobacterales bacterium]
MRLPYLTEEFLQAVRSAALSEHGTRYSQPESWVRELPGAQSGIRESQIEVVELPELPCESDARTESDAANAIALYERLKGLSPVQASDERLWACLSHTHYWRYMCTRWPRGHDDSFESIETRWFFKGNSMERLARNGLARLWWGAYATVQSENPDPYHLTRILFQNTEIQFAYMERLLGKNRCVLHTTLDFIERNAPRIRLRQSSSDWARDTSKLINRVGGVLQLDALSDSDVVAILESHLLDLYRRQQRQG